MSREDERDALRFGLRRRSRDRWALSLLIATAVVVGVVVALAVAGDLDALLHLRRKVLLSLAVVAVVAPGAAIHAVLRAFAPAGEKMARKVEG